MTGVDLFLESEGPAVYQIVVQGRLDETWSEWFEDMTIRPDEAPGNQTMTLLTGPVPDQPALRAILQKLWNLNLTLISVVRLEHDRAADA